MVAYFSFSIFEIDIYHKFLFFFAFRFNQKFFGGLWPKNQLKETYFLKGITVIGELWRLLGYTNENEYRKPGNKSHSPKNFFIYSKCRKRAPSKSQIFIYNLNILTNKILYFM